MIPSEATGGFLLWDAAMDALEVDPEEVEDLIGAVAFLGRYGGQSIEACERMQPHKLYRYVSAVARLLSEEHSGWRTEDP